MELTAGGFFVMFVLIMLLFGVVPLVLWIYAIVEAVRAPEPAFGPPWDNSKNAWILGIALSMVIPFGTLVAGVLWWVQGHKALRARTVVPRPFWSPAPRPYPPPPPGPQPPQGYGG